MCRVMERFYVATTSGYLEDGRRGGRRGPGVSAMILDRLDLHRVIYTYRSEQIKRPQGSNVAEAKRRATEYAALLNKKPDARPPRWSGAAHGSITRYAAGRCRCDKCRAANAAKTRLYDARRRDRNS